MVCSMTGFARAKIAGYLVEVQTINKKGAEISLSLPRELALKESFIRKKLGSLLQRGHAFIKVFPESGGEQKISKEACKKVHAHLTEIANSLDPTYKVSFDTVIHVLSEFPPAEEESKDWEEVWNTGLDEFWKALTVMRQKEGEALVADVCMRLELILKSVLVLEKENLHAPEFFGKKILEKLENFKAVRDEDKDRVLREVMLYSEKVDINE